MSETPERALGFPAFGPSKRRRGRFARSWWGNAWNEAVEEDALDHAQLRGGRAYAYGGHVGPITVSPGRVAATVYDDHSSHATMVSVERLGGAEWDRFLDQVAARSGHIAALLDRDMPQDLVDDAADAGVRLLPGVGDLEPECSCPGWEHPCKHAAALCFQVSWLLDADPFLLLLMRGRGEQDLLEELRRRSTQRSASGAPGAGPAAPAREGTPAREAFAARVAPLPALPLPALPPPVEGPAAVQVADIPPPPVPGIDVELLKRLAEQAAERARALL